MQIIQPHYHAIARTAQDYERMAMSGVVAVAEPAFWAGFDRLYPETFIDYFRQISEFEPTRAAQPHLAEPQGRPTGADGTQQKLPFCTDVPDVAAIAHRQSQRTQHQGRGLEQHLPHQTRMGQWLDKEHRQATKGVLAEQGKQQARQNGREHQGHHRGGPGHHRRGLGAALQNEAHAAAPVAGAIGYG